VFQLWKELTHYLTLWMASGASHLWVYGIYTSRMYTG